MAKPAIGAMISDGGRGAFPADILCIGNVNVVVANPKLAGIVYDREEATHVMVEFPDRIYMNKERGFIVLPAKQLKEVV